jgi:hypothetical protein
MREENKKKNHFLIGETFITSLKCIIRKYLFSESLFLVVGRKESIDLL